MTRLSSLAPASMLIVWPATIVAMLATLMFVSPAFEAAASVVPIPLIEATLMFVSPACAALAPPVVHAVLAVGHASVVSPLTSPVLPLPGTRFVFVFGAG